MIIMIFRFEHMDIDREHELETPTTAARRRGRHSYDESLARAAGLRHSAAEIVHMPQHEFNALLNNNQLLYTEVRCSYSL